METTLGEITSLVGGAILRGDKAKRLSRFASLDQADALSVSFFGNEKYRDDLAATRAGAVLVPREGDFSAPEATAIVAVENTILAFDLVLRHFGVASPAFVPGVHPAAWVAPDAELDPEEVSVQPNATILSGAKVGRGTRIGAGAVIGEGAIVGEDCVIGPNATVREGCVLGDRVILHSGAVVGSDGFGFEFVEGRHRKIDQLGIVRIGDDVEIGASTTIDRARFGETVIGEGTKIDNQVQIAHNVVVGRHCILVAQVGIAGSVRLGDYVTLAAQSGIGGHLQIADRVTCGGRSGVIASIEEPGGTYFGYPAKPMKESLRDSMRVKQLGGLLKRVKALEKKLE